jgi:hypothetical protein
MAVLLWLAIPLVAFVIGIVWAYLISRPPRPAAMLESMESFTKFRQAFERPAKVRRRRWARLVKRRARKSTSGR